MMQYTPLVGKFGITSAYILLCSTPALMIPNFPTCGVYYIIHHPSGVEYSYNTLPTEEQSKDSIAPQ